MLITNEAHPFVQILFWLSFQFDHNKLRLSPSFLQLFKWRDYFLIFFTKLASKTAYSISIFFLFEIKYKNMWFMEEPSTTLIKALSSYFKIPATSFSFNREHWRMRIRSCYFIYFIKLLIKQQLVKLSLRNVRKPKEITW